MVSESIHIEAVAADRLIDLRVEVLRFGLPPDTAVFDGDDHPEAIHLAAIDDAQGGAVVGCVTMIPNPFPGEDEPALQLRGMAVAEALRNSGLGGRLLAEAHRCAAGRPIWCNARTPAARFYQRHGWATASDVFDVPTAGSHVRMRYQPAADQPPAGA